MVYIYKDENMKNLILISVLILVIGCDSLIIKDDKNIEMYDDALIIQIQNATNKTEIGYDELPTNIISIVENTYSNKLFLSELRASGLGFELTYSDIDTDESFFKKIYFNLEGRKLISKINYNKRDEKCFELLYPITFIMPDQSNITISNNEDWVMIKDWYEQNPDFEERPQIEYPIDIMYESTNIVTINDEEEMTIEKSNCIDCMELVYPVTFILPDESTIIIENNSEEGWEELKNWYEDNPNVDFDWNLLYPLDIQLEDGTITTVQNVSEIELIKQECN